MKLLGLDFETTGLNFETERITEIGAVLWDTDLRQPVRILSALVRHSDAPPITPEIERLTGISQAMLDAHGEPPSVPFAQLVHLLNHCDYVVAHNGLGFDKPMLEAQIRRSVSLERFFPWTLPWIDTCMDLPIPAEITTRKLVHLAAEHGFLNPFAHRAIFDVLTMLRILEAYPLDEVCASACQPMVTLQALVSYDDREKAKARGYRWKAETRQWLRNLRAHHAAREQAECGFAIAIVPTA